MSVDRRELLRDSPITVAAALTVIDTPGLAPMSLDVAGVSKRLRVGEAAVEGALSRLERFLPKPAAMFTGTRTTPGTYRLETLQLKGAGHWQFEDRVDQIPDLGRAIAIGNREAGAGSERGLRLRWVAGCAFGGLTVLVYKARRATAGLIVPGHHYGWPPRALYIGP